MIIEYDLDINYNLLEDEYGGFTPESVFKVKEEDGEYFVDYQEADVCFYGETVEEVEKQLRSFIESDAVVRKIKGCKIRKLNKEENK